MGFPVALPFIPMLRPAAGPRKGSRRVKPGLSRAIRSVTRAIKVPTILWGGNFTMTTTRLGRLTIFTVTPAQLGGLYIFTATATFFRSHHGIFVGLHTQIILRRRGGHHPTIDAISSRRTNTFGWTYVSRHANSSRRPLIDTVSTGRYGRREDRASVGQFPLSARPGSRPQATPQGQNWKWMVAVLRETDCHHANSQPWRFRPPSVKRGRVLRRGHALAK